MSSQDGLTASFLLIQQKIKRSKTTKIDQEGSQKSTKNKSHANLVLLLAILLPHLHFLERSETSQKNHHQTKALRNKTGILQEQQNLPWLP
tara:strand:+ start:199 stop:471 length:273 start_codon:yes stop_codon:yes gene_type:complete